MPTLINRWAVLALLFGCRCAIAIQIAALAPVADLLIRDLRLSYARLGLLIGLYLLPGSVLALPGGMLADRFGGRAVMATGLGLMSAGMLLFTRAPGFEQAFVVAFAGRLAAGIGGVLVNVLLAKLVADWFGRRELTTAMSIQLTGWPLGFALSLATLGGLAAAVTWQVALDATAALAGTLFVVVLLFYRNPPVPADVANPRRVAGWNLSRAELSLSIASGVVWMIWNVSFLVFMSFAPLMLEAGGMTMARAGVVISLLSWLSMVSIPLGGYLIDRTGRPDLLMHVAILSSALIMFLLPLGWLVTPLIVIKGIIRGPSAGGINALPVEALRPENRATGFGVYLTLYYVGVALVPPLAGYLRDLYGTPSAPVLFSAACAVLTSLALVGFRLLEHRLAPAVPRVAAGG